MSVLWSSGAAAEATGGVAHGAWAATGLSIDTRSLLPGDLFIALKDQRDGHEFAAEALRKGAAAALVTHRPEDVPADAPLLIVPDTLEALEALAVAARQRSKARVIGVTGSAGKTTTKDMLRHMLSRFGQTHAAYKSFNNHWGVPLTLAALPQDAAFAVIEMGMNHAGEIAHLTRLVRPDVALITLVAPAHLAAFADVAAIARAKAEIYEGLGPKGVALYNQDLETSELLRARAEALGVAQIEGFGRAEGADAQLLELGYAGETTWAQIRLHGCALRFSIGALGAHLVMNALGAALAAAALGVDPQAALQALTDWRSGEGRGKAEVIAISGGALHVIDESYNANPSSMAAALERLVAQPSLGARGRKIAILGEMRELGVEAPALHAGLAALPQLQKIDQIYCIGDEMRHLHEALPEAQRGGYDTSSEAFCARLPALMADGKIAPDDQIMIKGSNGLRMAQIVTGFRALAAPQPSIKPNTEKG